MQTTPFFSIIIPTLNEEDYIARLLDDLVKQKEKSFEVLIVDGGSEDATRKKALEFGSKIPIKWVTSEKQNVSVQRNLGAKTAVGTYLVFLDADVQIPNRFLTLIKKYVAAHHSPYLTTHLRGDSRNVYDKAVVRLLNLTMEMAVLLERPFVGGFNFIIAKGVFDLVGGFREEIVHAEDYDLSVRLHKAGYRLTLMKSPQVVFSLRRFRHEGRLAVLRKNAKATLHVFTKGPITSEIFSYPMGGLWYRLKKREQIRPAVLSQLETRVKRFLRLFLE